MYNINSNLNKKEFFYFLGFFWSDGTINSEKYLVIEITEKDGEELKPIFNKVFDFKITNRKRKGRQPQMSFFYKDKNLCKFLIENGKYPKSIENHGKILSLIPEEYKIYFLRGLIDGDGCFYVMRPSKKWDNTVIHFTIGSSYDQDWTELILFLENFGIKMKPIKREYKKYKSSIIRSSNYYEIKNFVEKLYECDDNIFLKRKKEKIFEGIKLHEEKIKEHKLKRKKYEIIIGNNEPIVVDDLRRYCMENDLCYCNMCKLANRKINKYKNIKIKKI